MEPQRHNIRIFDLEALSIFGHCLFFLYDINAPNHIVLLSIDFSKGFMP